MGLLLQYGTALPCTCSVHSSLSQKPVHGLSRRGCSPFAQSARQQRRCHIPSKKSHQLSINAVASVEKDADSAQAPSVSIDNKRDSQYSAVSVTAPARANVLGQITDTLTQLGLQIAKATVDNSNGTSVNKLYVCRADGSKLSNSKDIDALQHALESAISPQSTSLKRPLLKQTDTSVPEDKKNFLYTLMGECNN